MLIENSSARRPRARRGDAGTTPGRRRRNARGWSLCARPRAAAAACARGHQFILYDIRVPGASSSCARPLTMQREASGLHAGYNMPDGSWGGRLCKQQRALMGERMPERTRERNATTHKKLVVGLLAQVGKRRLSMQCPFQSGHVYGCARCLSLSCVGWSSLVVARFTSINTATGAVRAVRPL